MTKVHGFVNTSYCVSSGYAASGDRIAPSIDYPREVLSIRNSQAEYLRDGAMLEFFIARCVRPKGVHEYMTHRIHLICSLKLVLLSTLGLVKISKSIVIELNRI